MTAHKFWIAKPYADLVPLPEPKKQRRLSAETVQQILNMRKAGKTKDAIAAALGVGTTAIDRVCRKHLTDYDRAEIRSTIQRSKSCYDTCPARVKREQILELRRQGLSYVKIANQLGLHQASVRPICKDLGYLEEAIVSANEARTRFTPGARRAHKPGCNCVVCKRRVI